MVSPTSDPFLNEIDPYEYTLVNYALTTAPANTVNTVNIPGTVVNLGMVGFNPLAGGQNGIAPITARISYSVHDWHVIHEDHDVPSSGEGTSVPLILKHLKKLGDIDKDSVMYTGLFDTIDTPSAQNKFDVVVVDRDTGDSYGDVYDLAEAVPPYPTNAIGVSYQAGYLRFPDSFAKAHTHIRVFYAGKPTRPIGATST